MMHDIVDVELVQERVAIFADRSCEDNDFVQFPDPFEKGIDARPLDYVDVVVLAFDFDGYSEVRVVEKLHGGQYETLLQNQST